MRNLYDEFDDLPEDEKAESESMESTESTGPTIYILPGATIELRRSRRVNVSFAVAAAGGLLAWAAILWVVLTAFEGAWKR